MLMRVLHHHTFSLPPSTFTCASPSNPIKPAHEGSPADAARRGGVLPYHLPHLLLAPSTGPTVCATTLNVYNAYPLPAPSSHWGFHVADAARRGVTMCSALPPASSLA